VQLGQFSGILACIAGRADFSAPTSWVARRVNSVLASGRQSTALRRFAVAQRLAHETDPSTSHFDWSFKRSVLASGAMARRSVCDSLLITIALMVGAAICPTHSFAAAVEPVQFQQRMAKTFPFPGTSSESAAPRVDRPYFDHSGQLRWADVPVHNDATGSCDTQPPQRNANGYPLYPRQTKLFAPRVDERLCNRAGMPAEIALIGFDDDGKKSWERPTAFQSGSHRIDLRLIGASTDGLVLSSLEVWSPKSGATIVPAATRAIPSESRAVPLHSYWGAALYHPARKTFYVFDATVTLTTRQGGLYEINPSSGMKILVHRVVTTLLSGYDRIEEMALTPDGRYLALAQRLSWRGPTDVSLAILDLSTNRLVFHERFCKSSNDICSDPRVIVGVNGALAFSYANMNRREHLLIMYELRY